MKRITSGLIVGAIVIFTLVCLPNYICNILATLVAVASTYEFIKAIKNCATYLRDTVVPDLEKQEQAIADTMSSFTTGQ